MWESPPQLPEHLLGKLSVSTLMGVFTVESQSPQLARPGLPTPLLQAFSCDSSKKIYLSSLHVHRVVPCLCHMSSLCLETPSFASLPGSLPCRFSWSWPEQCPLTAGPSVFFHVPVITTVITPIVQASSLFFPSSSANCHCPTVGHGEQRDLSD